MKLTCICTAGLPGQAETTASISGDVLTVDGTPYDLSAVPDGGFAEPEGSHPFAGRIERTGGELHVPLLWRYSTATAEPNQPAEPPVLSVTSGPVPDPTLRKPQPEETEA